MAGLTHGLLHRHLGLGCDGTWLGGLGWARLQMELAPRPAVRVAALELRQHLGARAEALERPLEIRGQLMHLAAALGERGVRWVSFADWQKIDAAEIAAAPDGAPRRKFTTVADMLAVLD